MVTIRATLLGSIVAFTLGLVLTLLLRTGIRAVTVVVCAVIEFVRSTPLLVGGNVVLRELDFAVRPGEHVTLIGPSGSGKTTILRLLMTLERVSSETIPRRRDVPDAHGQGRPARTGQREATPARHASGSGWCSKNLTEAPVLVLRKSKDEAERHARELLKRVAIARAVAMQPEVLLLDEVTSALDPELVAGVPGVLRDIAKTTAMR